jgi:hypothetical protein
VRRLTPDGAAFSDVVTASGRAPRLTSDGRFVAYWFDGDADELHDLYVVSRFGGAPRRMTASRPPGSHSIDQLRFEITADGRYVVAAIDQETVERLELWSAPIDGDASDAFKISGALAPGEEVWSFSLSSDGERAFFFTVVAGDVRVYVTPVDGSAAPTRIDAPGTNDEEIHSWKFGGDHVFWLDATNEVHSLWRAPVDGSAAAIRVNDDLVEGGQVSHFWISPDATRIVYRADARFVDLFELWSVPAGGPASAATRLSPDLPPAGDVRSSGLEISAAPPRVLFLADSAVDEQTELWSVPLDGPATEAVHLNVSLGFGGDVSPFLSVLGESVIYLADNAVDERQQAWTVPIDGPLSASVRLHGDLGPGQSVSSAGFLPGSAGPLALLVGTLRDSGKLEPFLQDSSSPGVPYPLYGDLPAGSGLQSSCAGGVTPDLSSFVLCADLDTAERVELQRLDMEFGSTPDELSATFTVPDADVTLALVSSDGIWAAYRADEATDERFDLHRVRVDGSAPPHRVHATPPSASHDVDPVAVYFTRDGAGLVYAADHEVDGQLDLWISDSAIYRDDFELGHVGGWSG